MSKLVNAIYAREQRTRATPLDTIRVTETWSPVEDYAGRKLREYRIGVELRHNVQLTEEALHQSESHVLREAVAMVKDAVIEEVFGEFRPHLRAIELALWNRDIPSALDAHRTLETLMFSREE